MGFLRYEYVILDRGCIIDWVVFIFCEVYGNKLFRYNYIFYIFLEVLYIFWFVSKRIEYIFI